MFSLFYFFAIVVNLNANHDFLAVQFPAEKPTQTESSGTCKVVPPSERYPRFEPFTAPATDQDAQGAPFKRPWAPQDNHDGDSRILCLELSLRTALREEACALSGLPRALDGRHSPFKQAQVTKGLCQPGGLVMGMVSRPPEKGTRCQTKPEGVDEKRECKSKGRQRQREREKDGCGVTVFPEHFYTLAIAGNHSCISDAIPTADPYCTGFNGTELRCQRHRAYAGCEGAVPRHHQGTSQDPTGCGQGGKEDYAKTIDVRSSQDIECSRERHQGVASPQGCKGQAQRALAQALARISAMLGTATQALFGAAAQLQWPHQKGQARPGHGEANLGGPQQEGRRPRRSRSGDGRARRYKICRHRSNSPGCPSPTGLAGLCQGGNKGRDDGDLRYRGNNGPSQQTPKVARAIWWTTCWCAWYVSIGSETTCLLNENEFRGPCTGDTTQAIGADAYPFGEWGAASNMDLLASFTCPLTACHSAIWDPSILFMDTFTALGRAVHLRGEVLLASCLSASPAVPITTSSSSIMSERKSSCRKSALTKTCNKVHFCNFIEAYQVTGFASIEPLNVTEVFDEISLMARAANTTATIGELLH